MDNGFMEAASAFWDKRLDTLAVPSRELDAELEKAQVALTATYTDAQMDLYVDFEERLNLRDSQVKEFFYKKGFEDAVRFLYGVLKEGSDGDK